MTAEPLYVYGLMEASAAEQVAAADPSRRLLPVVTGDVAAVCEAVCPESVAAAATDDDQLAALARRHDSVVHLLAGYGATLPARLGTLCEAAFLVKALDAAQAELREQLQLVRGCHEWRLRVASPAPARRRERVPHRDVSGTDYLRERLAQRAAVAERPQTSFSRLDAVLSEFSTATGDVLAEAGASSHARSYLVEDTRTDALLAALQPLLDQAAQAGEQAHLDGPAPAYSFAQLQLGVPR